MTKPLAFILSLTALTLGGCDSSSDNEDLSSERGGSGCTHSKDYWRTHNGTRTARPCTPTSTTCSAPTAAATTTS